MKAQRRVNLPLVTIDPGSHRVHPDQYALIFILFKVFLFKPVGKIIDKRNEMAAAEIAEAKRAKESACKDRAGVHREAREG